MSRFTVFAAGLVAFATGASGSTPLARWGPPVRAGTLPFAAWATELKTADVNGDDLRDVVVTQLVWGSQTTIPVNILLNRGRGRFTPAPRTMFVGRPPETQAARAILSADFNGDRRDDLFIADSGTDTENGTRNGHQNELVLTTADGKLVDATRTLPQHSSFTHSAAVGDIDGNGTIDVFVGNLNCCGDQTRPEFLLNDGTGRFTEAFDQLAGLPLAYGVNFSYTSSLLVDVNRDGSPDLVLGGMEYWPRSVVMLNDGHGHFRFFENLPPKLFGGQNGIVLDIVPVDLNGDGALDLLSAESQAEPYYLGTRVQALVNDGSGRFHDETAARIPQQPDGQSWPDRILLADLNGDGQRDFAIAFAGPGKVAVPDPTPFWLNTGNGVFTRFEGAKQGSLPSQRGPVGLVDGAGPEALFSVDSTERPGADYYTSWQLVQLKAPDGIIAIRSSSRAIRISWHAVDGAEKYEVWRAPRPDASPSRIGTTRTTAYTDRTAGRRHTYRYTVRAVEFGERGAFSKPVTARRP